jgi:hypothetical protein
MGINQVSAVFFSLLGNTLVSGFSGFRAGAAGLQFLTIGTYWN